MKPPHQRHLRLVANDISSQPSDRAREAGELINTSTRRHPANNQRDTYIQPTLDFTGDETT